jgi:hypothetical protein
LQGSAGRERLAQIGETMGAQIVLALCPRLDAEPAAQNVLDEHLCTRTSRNSVRRMGAARLLQM